MPLARTAPYGEGEDVPLGLWLGNLSVCRDAARFVALEGRVWSVVSSDMLVLADVPHDFEFHDELAASGLNEIFVGELQIIDPRGSAVASAADGAEALVAHDLDMAAVREARHSFDPTGHTARHLYVRYRAATRGGGCAMNLTFFKNSRAGGPGLIGEYALERGWSIRQIIDFEAASRHAAEPLRDDVVVFLGSPRSALEMDETWIAHEFDLMRRLLEFGTPMLGVCFGSQLLARVIGGNVSTMPKAFRGWHGNEDVSHEAWRGPWLRWHRDRIFLPQGVRPLATSADIVQGFAVGRAVGVQFHPEATPEILQSWVAAANGDTPLSALAEAEAVMRSDAVAIRQRCFDLLDHVFEAMLMRR